MMTMSGLESRSPLKAAREWRGLSLPVAARSSGLPLTQVEALEDGDSSAFETVEEMVAASVLYTAALGVGQDEALALLDRAAQRAVAAQHTPVPELAQQSFDEHPAVVGAGLPQFSAEVQRRSQQGPVADLNLQPFDVDGFPSQELEAQVDVPAVSDSVRAATELDPAYREAVEQSTSELEAWAIEQATQRRLDDTGEIPRVTTTLGNVTFMERVAAFRDRAVEDIDRATTSFRETLRRSEHATLIVAVAVGAMLFALLIAISSAIGGGDDSSNKVGATKTPAKSQSADANQTATSTPTENATETPTTPKAAAPTAIIPRGSITIEVLNAGHVKGKAATTADTMKKLGYRLGDVGNTQTRYASSMILFPKGMDREAERLSKDSGITTMDTIPSTAAGQSPHTITVVTV
jgi:hypothetical protein